MMQPFLEQTLRDSTARKTLLSRQERECREARRQARASHFQAIPEESELPTVEAFSEAEESELPFVEVSLGESEDREELEPRRATILNSPREHVRREVQMEMQGGNLDTMDGAAQLFDNLQVGGGADAIGTPPQIEHNDPSGAGLAKSKSSDDQNSSTSLLAG
ncbi:hypothetical protein R1flu_015210 [Riccia fluitans]|uniref:Uncharacterized protein n=1 Tax=Riccia fluitans TaxID=41844 RepID=A0ABD1YJE0_9MARC